MTGEWDGLDVMLAALGGSVPPPEVCWNPSKATPARIDALCDAFAEALPALRWKLLPHAPSREYYVDMPRLLDSLDADRFRTEPRMVPPAALQLLDFRPAGDGARWGWQDRLAGFRSRSVFVDGGR